MYKLLRSLLFLLPAETAHHFSLVVLSVVLKIPILNTLFKAKSEYEGLEKTVMGIRFKNPVGLAAGFDKDGKYIHILSQLGFGFVEIGTVTPKPQDGNPKPRLFRLKKDHAIINRMGFNNEGVDALVSRLKTLKNRKNIIIGGNIGKNKVTPNENAIDDYLICFNKLHDYVDYFVVNVSSPNTPNLRELQDKEPLQKLLLTLAEENAKKQNPKPILLKIAPDLTPTQIDDVIDIINHSDISGIISNNTTISRANLLSDKSLIDQAGGLSGKPLTQVSLERIKFIKSKLAPNKTLIGVGGIMNSEDAKMRLEAGADLVQLYTGFVYNGPKLIKSINSLLLK